MWSKDHEKDINFLKRSRIKMQRISSMNFIKESPKMHFFVKRSHKKKEFYQKISKENANFGKGLQKTHKFKQRTAKTQ